MPVMMNAIEGIVGLPKEAAADSLQAELLLFNQNSSKISKGSVLEWRKQV